jgi:hypothetical protein
MKCPRSTTIYSRVMTTTPSPSASQPRGSGTSGARGSERARGNFSETTGAHLMVPIPPAFGREGVVLSPGGPGTPIAGGIPDVAPNFKAVERGVVPA